jgi:hypothetical protein
MGVVEISDGYVHLLRVTPIASGYEVHGKMFYEHVWH